MGKNDSLVYFNNCANRDHAGIFGGDAFFDLNTTGKDASKARDLIAGQACVVASKASDENIVFKWYLFSHERVLIDDAGSPCRVFFGTLFESESLLKIEAIHHAKYTPYFNINGHFKRQSAISVDGNESTIAWINKHAPFGMPDEVSDVPETFPEGRLRKVIVNGYERSIEARNRCIQFHGTACGVCEIEFGKAYGKDCEGFVHVHHLKPLSDIRRGYEVNPEEDLRPVCPNCHAVIHMGGTLRSIQEVKDMLHRQRETSRTKLSESLGEPLRV